MKTADKWQNYGVDHKHNRGPWSQTWSGGRFFPQDPSVSEVNIRDIAAALSKQCRFNGHTSHFYSVAQHSVLMTRMVSKEHKLEALLHDAAEAYVGDLVRPVKIACPDFKAIDNKVDFIVRLHFGLPDDMSEEVHDADMKICSAEKRDLMPRSEVWPDMPPCDDIPTIVPWSWKYAERMFLNEYRRLTGVR